MEKSLRWKVFEKTFEMPATPNISGLGNWRVNALWREAISVEGLYLKCHLIPMSPILHFT